MYRQQYLVEPAMALARLPALNPQNVGLVPAWEKFARNKDFSQLSEPAPHVLALGK
jgi:hypothetical protein|tara:strand:- start:1917 stop:2084 length:168 start_codon:yes stop_codon:yes gene_type:complete